MGEMAFKNPSFHIEFHLHKLQRVMLFPQFSQLPAMNQIKWKTSVRLINETLFCKDLLLFGEKWLGFFSKFFLRPEMWDKSSSVFGSGANDR